MYIARKITDIHKFFDWRLWNDSFSEFLTSEVDGFSSVIDCDENSRALKRRVHKLWHGQLEVVVIFRQTSLVPRLLAFDSVRNMALDDRWSKRWL